jgi:hypothetical protein
MQIDPLLTRDCPITRRFPSGFTVYPPASRRGVFVTFDTRHKVFFCCLLLSEKTAEEN